MPRRRRDPSELSETQKEILEAVGCYYNGITFIGLDGERVYKLGRTVPPDIETLVRVLHDATADEYEKVYEPAVSDLRSEGWLRTAYIHRKQITWDPSRDARRFLDEHLADRPYERHVPAWLTRDHGRGLAGDLNGTLQHRNAVETARFAFQEMGYNVTDVYPGSGGQRRCDIHMENRYGPETAVEWAAEILTPHNDTEAYREKYEFTAAHDRSIQYVFHSRKLATKCLNLWHEDDDLPAEFENFPIANPEDRAMQDVKDYFERSLNSSEYKTHGVQGIETATRLFDRYCYPPEVND